MSLPKATMTKQPTSAPAFTFQPREGACPENVAFSIEELRQWGTVTIIAATGSDTERFNAGAEALLDALWEVYPKRPGSTKPATLTQIKARLRAGYYPKHILTGAITYAAYAIAPVRICFG